MQLDICETNSRPVSGPKCNLLKSLAGEPGFEPGLTESESVGLPLTYSPVGRRDGKALLR